MSPRKTPSFPEAAFAELARFYGRDHDLCRLTAQCRAKKPGYRLQSLSLEEVASVLAKHAAENAPDRHHALEEFSRALGKRAEPPGKPEKPLAQREPKEIQSQVESLTDLTPEKRAVWLVTLLSDSRAEVRALADRLGKKKRSRKKPATPAVLRRERDEARRGLRSVQRERDRLVQSLEKARQDLEKARQGLQDARADRGRLRQEVSRLKRDVSREVTQRKRAEEREARAADEARREREKAESRKVEVQELRRHSLQVRDAPASRKEWQNLHAALSQEKKKYAALTQMYAALTQKLRGLEERVAEAWVAEKIDFQELAPRPESVAPTPQKPVRRDSRSPDEKVQLPSVPHHWPGGRARFERYLKRIARSPYVARVMPGKFRQVVRHRITRVMEEGDLVAWVTDGQSSAELLILTTATDPDQGEYVRRELDRLFDEGGV